MCSLKKVLEDIEEPPPKRVKDHFMVKNLKAVMDNTGIETTETGIFVYGKKIFLDGTLLGSTMKILSREIPIYELKE